MKEFFLIEQPYESAFSELVNAIDTENDTIYTIHYRSDFANSKIIRDFVGAIFDAFEVPVPWRGRFVLITDELVNNSIEHGSEKNDINECIIKTHRKADNSLFRISVEVHDTGKWRHKTNLPDEILHKKGEKFDSDEVYMGKRGRGLFRITEKIVDKLTFGVSNKGGLVVKIEKCIDTNNNSCHEEEKSEKSHEKNAEKISEKKS